MKSTTYTGIDYGAGRSNIDNTTGIRFGVIAQNSIDQDAFNDVWMNARDLSYEAAVEAFKHALKDCENGDELRSVVREHCGHWVFQGCLDGLTVGDVEAIWSEVEDHFNAAYSMADCGERDWLYESAGYKLANCLTSDVMVLASPYFTYAQFCSPCVPGACNLDNPLDVIASDGLPMPSSLVEHDRCYCLGHDFFTDNKAPYPVYSVATGELVPSE